jgi:O-methyltransferase
VDLDDLYIELVKRSVNGDLHGPQSIIVPVDPRRRTSKLINRMMSSRGLSVGRRIEVPESAYAEGAGWPASMAEGRSRGRSSWPDTGESMAGRARLDNVHEAVDSVLEENIPGNLIETGVWRGGATILMRAVLKARRCSDRFVFVADSFQGLPAATVASDDAGYLHLDSGLAVSLDEVRENFRRYQLLDDQVRFVKGWFSETLPDLLEERWAVVRLDGDMYESTMDGLVNLYPGLSSGGWLIVDDYGTYVSCRRAVDEYRLEHRIADEIVAIDRTGVYWRKSGPPSAS